LLVYLHGIVPPERTSAIKLNLHTVLKNAARRAGVAVLLPRGIQGLAPRGHDRWWGWPTGGAAYDRHAPRLVQRFAEQRAQFESAVGVRFTRVYVAGSSSGAYFVVALALRGAIEADGFAALSGGAGARTGALERATPRPFYIGYGLQDSVRGSARALADLLRAQGWPVRIEGHPVGHGAREIYLDEAFAFWGQHQR
jgi:predicted esterase